MPDKLASGCKVNKRQSRKKCIAREIPMAEYRLFFSWQNDRKDTKAIINSALKRAKNKLKANGIDLFVDQDTRERVGKTTGNNPL